MHYAKPAGALFLVLAAQLCFALPSSAGSAATTGYSGVCRHVVDGDSLYLTGLDTQIRLWGVDAPERDEAGFDAARSLLQRLAANKMLYCEQKAIDKYQRIVARCYLDKQQSPQQEINRLLLNSKLAKEYCWFSKNHYGFCRR